MHELEPLIADDDYLNQQFVLYNNMIICKTKMNLKDNLNGLEQAIRITQPRYGTIKLYECLLSFDEITIINNIANVYSELGEYNTGINLLFEIKEYMDLKYINSDEKMRLYPMIIYNLSKWLGLYGRYQDAIVICNIGIASCQNSGRAKLLYRLLYNKAWCMIKVKFYQVCYNVLMQAYYVALALGDNDAANKYKNYMLNNINLNIEDSSIVQWL